MTRLLLLLLPGEGILDLLLDHLLLPPSPRGTFGDVMLLLRLRGRNALRDRELYDHLALSLLPSQCSHSPIQTGAAQ